MINKISFYVIFPFLGFCGRSYEKNDIIVNKSRK